VAAYQRSFIIRIWQTEDGSITGQISDAQEGWRQPFRSAADLWQVIETYATLSASSEERSRDGSSDLTSFREEKSS